LASGQDQGELPPAGNLAAMPASPCPAPIREAGPVHWVRCPAGPRQSPGGQRASGLRCWRSRKQSMARTQCYLRPPRPAHRNAPETAQAVLSRTIPVSVPAVCVTRVVAAFAGPFRWAGRAPVPCHANAAAGHPHRAGHPHSESVTIGPGGQMPPAQRSLAIHAHTPAAASSPVALGMPATAGRECRLALADALDAICRHLPWLAGLPFSRARHHRRRNARYPMTVPGVMRQATAYWPVTLRIGLSRFPLKAPRQEGGCRSRCFPLRPG